jgi:hypothetical protein
MGDTGQTRFIEHLVRLGWTERNTVVQRAILAGLDRLVSAGNRPPGLEGLSNPAEKMKFWMNWWEQQHPGIVRDERTAASG